MNHEIKPDSAAAAADKSGRPARPAPEKVMWVGFRRPDSAIYFVGEGGICTPDMKGPHGQKLVHPVKYDRTPGYLYFLDGEGDISRVGRPAKKTLTIDPADAELAALTLGLQINKLDSLIALNGKTDGMLGERMAGMIDCRDRLARVVDALKVL